MLRCFLLLVMVLSSGCGGDSEGTPPAGKKPAVRRSLSTRSESGSKESDRLKALRKAVRGGDTAAMLELAECYRLGQEVARDPFQSIRLLQKAAREENVVAALRAGHLVHAGYAEVDPDPDGAVGWYRRAAKGGNADGMVMLGELVRVSDPKMAAQWFARAAEKGSGRAMIRLGEACAGGAVPLDRQKARGWYQKASEQDPEGMLKRVEMDFAANPDLHLDPASNSARGARLLQALIERTAKASKPQGCTCFSPLPCAACHAYEIGTRAMALMARAYQQGLGVQPDHARAVEWCRKAHQRGSNDATVQLAMHYLRGQGVRRDRGKAMKLLIDGAGKGHPEALVTLGMIYDEGVGVSKDPFKALKWYRKAAETGDAAAINNMGVIYLDARLVPRNFDRALQLFRKAAARGSIIAKTNLARMRFLSSTTTRTDVQESIRWLSTAASRGDLGAMLGFGELYFRGAPGVARNLNKAEEWLNKVLQSGNQGSNWHGVRRAARVLLGKVKRARSNG